MSEPVHLVSLYVCGKPRSWCGESFTIEGTTVVNGTEDIEATTCLACRKRYDRALSTVLSEKND